MQFQLRAVSGSRTVDNVTGVLLSTPLGEMDVLDRHAELMGVSVGGKLTVRTKDGAESFVVTGGHVHVDATGVSLMVTRAIDLGKLDRAALQTEYAALPAPVKDGPDRYAETRAVLELALGTGAAN